MFMAVFRHCYLRAENRVSENIMRIGKSPTRFEITEYSPARVTLAILVSIPNQVGYYAQRLDILKLCLESAVGHAGVPVDLLVFDNGSSPEVRQYLTELYEKGFIQYLILSSQNIGKIGALKIMFSATPGEIVAYADDDIFFYPEWLSAHLDLLDHFPYAGLISGCPVREQFKYGNSHLNEILDSTSLLSLEAGHLIPDHIYRRDMEGVTIGDIVWFEDTFDDDEQTLIFSLQRMHDGYDPGLWAQRLDSIARAREVETYVVDEFLA